MHSTVRTEIQRIEDTVALLGALAFEDEPDLRVRVFVGYSLHSCYTGVEKILTEAHRATKRPLPVSETWHTDLLRNSGFILAPETQLELARLLAFRHVFRSHYPTELDWDRLKPLAEGFGAIMSRTISEFETYLETLP